MSLVTDGDSSCLVKYLEDAIPAGPHPEPHAEWVSVRLDVVQKAIDHIDWIEKGNDEWREMYEAEAKKSEAARATARVAIGLLDAVVKTGPLPIDDFNARCRALDWLSSIGAS